MPNFNFPYLFGKLRQRASSLKPILFCEFCKLAKKNPRNRSKPVKYLKSHFLAEWLPNSYSIQFFFSVYSPSSLKASSGMKWLQDMAFSGLTLTEQKLNDVQYMTVLCTLKCS